MNDCPHLFVYWQNPIHIVQQLFLNLNFEQNKLHNNVKLKIQPRCLMTSSQLALQRALGSTEFSKSILETGANGLYNHLYIDQIEDGLDCMLTRHNDPVL